MIRVGIDTGGTNTDVVLIDLKKGNVFSTKTATTTNNLLEGIARGIEKITGIADVQCQDIKELIYGTTIVVNMIAQKEAEATALITTKGFRDILSIGRAYRDKNIYDIYMDQSAPLIPRYLRYEVTERIGFRGDIIEPLLKEEVLNIIDDLRNKGIRSIAVSLLHSYANPVHEQNIKQIIHQQWPEMYVSLSSEVNPQFREYERTSTTVINAYMQPNMTSHLRDFETMISRNRVIPNLYIMQGNAGVVRFKAAMKKPVSVADSGPIAGIIASNHLGKMTGIPNIITLDMGGTSCDVSLIQGNNFQFTTSREVEGYPINLPTVDLNFIGAGGGSIAWHDQGGALKVGPRSAGAYPGPVCYCRGGTQPTVTDANLVTGRIRPEIFLEAISPETKTRTQEVIKCSIAEPLGLDIIRASEGIIEVVNSNMIRAIKVISVERGHDPRDFSLMAFGGAGGLHAAKLAQELEIPRVIIPFSPGTFSAFGLVLSDIKYDYVHTKITKQDNLDPEEITGIFRELESMGNKDLDSEDVPISERLLMRTCDIRYFGQAFELSVNTSPGKLGKNEIENLIEQFHLMHEKVYGHSMRKDPIEIVNFRVSAIGMLLKPDMNQNQAWETGQKHREPFQGTAIFDGSEHAVTVYDRVSLEEGQSIEGPAIIGEMGGTTVIYPGQKAIIDKWRNIIIYTSLQK